MAFLKTLKVNATAWTAANPWKSIVTMFIAGVLVGWAIL